MQFKRDSDVAIAMIDGAGRNTLEGAGRESEGKRQTAFRKDLAQNSSALVDGDCYIS
jgi:hypothetical protein